MPIVLIAFGIGIMIELLWDMAGVKISKMKLHSFWAPLNFLYYLNLSDMSVSYHPYFRTDANRSDLYWKCKGMPNQIEKPL